MRKLSVRECYFILVIILLISFSFNIYFSLDNSRYENKIGERSNNEICSIKDKNEANLMMLEMVTQKGSISKKDIVNLYSNNNVISKNLNVLLSEYNDYKDEKSIFNKKVVSNNGVVLDDVYAKANSFILYIMENNEIQKIDGTSFFILNDSDKKNFNIMYNLSVNIKKYFDDLTVEYPIENNKFKEAITEDKLWIDILSDLKDINEKNNYISLPTE